MPFNGSGSFVRSFPAGGWAGDAAAGTKILASRHDTHDNDLATGLSNVICKDGQSSPSADIPFNGKKITNLGAPTAGTDAATKTYVDAVRSFSTGISITGAVPDSRIGFTVADLGFGTRTAGTPAGSLNRFVWNNKPDLSGNDIAVMDELGRMSLAYVGGGVQAIPANSRSALTINGDINYIGGYSMVWNGYLDSVASAYKAFGAGWVSVINAAQASGIINIVRSSASIAAGATASMANVATFDPAAGVTFVDPAFQYGNGTANIWHQNRSQTIVNYKIAGAGSFNWYKTSNGLNSGGSPTSIMTLTDGGDLTVSSNMYALAGSFIGTASAAILAPSAASGQAILRPNGAGSTSGQFIVQANGDAVASGVVYSTSGYFASSASTVVLAPTGAGQIYFRPNGIGSTTGQAFFDSSGNLALSGNVLPVATMNIGNGGAGRVVQFASGWYLDWNSVSGDLLWRGGGGGIHSFLATGNLTISGAVATKASGTAWVAASDIRLKDVRGPYEHGLAELLQVNPVLFNYKSNPEVELVGVIAQDIEGVMPETVFQTEGEIDGAKVADQRMFDATALQFALINAVKELSGKLDQAMARIAVLEGAPA